MVREERRRWWWRRRWSWPKRQTNERRTS